VANSSSGVRNASFSLKVTKVSARERNLAPKPLTAIRNGVDVGGEDVVDDPAEDVLVRLGG